MSEWAKGLLEIRHEACDTIGDITKKVRVEVVDFEGKMDATQFVDWLAAIEEYFNWYYDSCLIGVSADSCPAGAPWLRE